MNCIILVKGQKNLRKEETSNENSDNYIIIYIDDEIRYGENSFFLWKRDMVSYVKYLDTEVHKKSDNTFPAFTVTNRGKPEITFPIPLEIHFSSCVSSLEGFFGCTFYPPGFDYNSDKFVEVDFSHFDSSCLESTKGLFKDCHIKKINFSNFNGKKIKDMSYMFATCTELTSLDLSSFNTSNVVSMSYMFKRLNGSISLNLSNFNTSKVTHLNSMFEASKFLVLDLSGFNFENVVYDSVNKDFFFIFTNSYLKFLSIKDIKINETKVKGKESIDIIEQINSIKNKTSMYLCLNDAKIMSQIDKNITICCEFDKNTQTCDSSNYFSLYYTNNVLYASGFENDNRKEIAFLKYGNQMKRAFESISIESNKNLDVKFAYPIDSLNNFFYNDVNKNTLVSLDFSKFDSSKITSVENVFNGLTSLKYIDLSGFGSHFLKSMKGLFKDLKSLESINLSNMKISKVTSIESMFENCVLLTSIDLSHLDTTSLIKIDKLFCGCSALKVIDFSNLNLENVNSASNIFYGLPTNFEYINLTNAKLSDALFSEIKSEINDKYYYLDCYTTEIIQNGDYKCCNTNGERMLPVFR